MAYQNINFPTIKLLHDFKDEVIRPVTIVSNFAKEYRIARYSAARRKFTFPERNITFADYGTLFTFIQTVGFQRDSFNFINPFNSISEKVRFDNIPVFTVVALTASNARRIMNVSEFSLITVFNE
jgi:hypothetical protein